METMSSHPADGPHPLDNAVWWALGSRHRALACAHGRARRYQSNVSVFGAVDRFDPASWRDLADLVGPSRSCALFRDSVPADLPVGWTEISRRRGRQMIVARQALATVRPVPLRRLTDEDVPQMVDLVARTEPGPFRTGTIQMGRYFGHFEGAMLVSMAGERMGFDGYTEISAVCTHPDARGRGLASALTHHVAAGIVERGEMPFLHVAESNDVAFRVYEKLGFVQRRIIEIVVVTPPPAAGDRHP
jgi:ribosomal protein S18 acetylase RimI-like enzyme